MTATEVATRTEEAAGGEGAGGRSSALLDGVHLAVLWSFAVLQPVLDVLSEDPTFFVARQVDGWAFVVPLLAFTVLPPAILLAVELLAGLGSGRWRRFAHLLFVCGLCGLLALYILKKLSPSAGLALYLLAVPGGLAGAALYQRFGGVRSFLTALSPAPVVFLMLFLFASPANGLIFPDTSNVAPTGQGSDTPVVVLVLDELPTSSLLDESGGIDARRFPGFARLARQSDWYLNTAAAADQTEEAVPALLTGRRPGDDAVPTVSDHPRNLFTLLAGSHRVNGMEHLTQLCPAELCPNETPALRRANSVASAMSLVYAHVVVPESMRERLPAIGRSWGEALASENPWDGPSDDAERIELSRYGDVQFERFLGSIRSSPRGQRPPLHLLHSSLPHHPWNYLPSGKVYDAIQAELPGLSKSLATWAPHRGLVQQGFQRHLLQAMFADRLLRRLLDRLERTGLYERSLVAVVADHGVAFTAPGERRAVNRTNAGDVALVPFFLKRPGQTRGRVLKQPIQTIDVMPTIADALRVRVPWRVDGRPAPVLAPEGRERARVVRHQGGQVEIAAATLKRQRGETLRRRLALFGTGRDPRLYAVGGDASLIGARPRGTRLRLLDADLEHPERHESVDPGSRFVPALVRGRVKGGGHPARVAITVNGRVAAIGPTYETGGDLRFSITVREQAFRAGRNDVRVLAVE